MTPIPGSLASLPGELTYIRGWIARELTYIRGWIAHWGRSFQIGHYQID